MTGYKILTHDGRPPIQGGDPLYTNQPLPYTLPAVTLDTSDCACGAGYNFCTTLVRAARIAGFWPSGRPAQCWVVETSADAIPREWKSRASQITLVRRCTADELRGAFRENVAEWAGDHTDALVKSQYAWYRALGRPLHVEVRVVAGLKEALAARKLDWPVISFDSEQKLGDAWAAEAAWDAWAAEAAWAAWAARAAWAAEAALIFESVVRLRWLTSYDDPLRLTTGLCDAYEHGLGYVLPVVHHNQPALGYVMDGSAVC